LAHLASLSEAQGVRQSTGGAGELRPRQYEQILATSGLLLSAFGLIALLWRQNDSLERMRRRQAAAASHYEFLASHDSLTGMPNRVSFSKTLSRAFANRLRAGGEVALLTLDLDNFKAVNDALGHAAGDQLLVSVADRLRHVAASQASVNAARLGGDEFSILVEGEDAEHRATRIAQDMLRALQQPVEFGGLSISTAASIGLAIAPRHGMSSADIVRCSDIALSCAKSSRRGALNIFDVALDHDAMGWRALESELANAIACDELEPFYQPQFDFSTGTIVGVEALIRWRRNDVVVPPIKFVPLAEKTGLIVSIDRLMLNRVCADALLMPASIKVAVNLSAAHFLCNDVAASVEQALVASRLSAHRLELEITESMLMTNEAQTRKILEQLRGLGASIALDDFGSGYSSFAYLRRFKFDKLKIDKAFIDDVVTDRQSCEILRAIAALGRTMGMTVVVEGVEQPEQARLAAQAGCALGQGYYFGRPMPFRDLMALLHRNAPRQWVAASA
jgi:diguanylate cyclase (GGDEF)-like protein